MSSEKRPKLSKTLSARFAENRIRRKYLQARILELDDLIQRALEGISKPGEKKVLKWARERRTLAVQLSRLQVARKPRTSGAPRKRRKKAAGGGGGAQGNLLDF